MAEFFLVILTAIAGLLVIAALVNRSGARRVAAAHEPAPSRHTTEISNQSPEVSDQPTDTEFGELHEFPRQIDRPELPDRYGADQMKLMVRDPYWLHTYWELTPAREIRAESETGVENYAIGRYVIRLIDLDSNHSWDQEVDPDIGNWYLNPGRPDTRFVCELGRIDRHGHYVPLLRSNEVRTPRDRPSDRVDPEWACPEELWQRLYSRSSGGTSPGMQLWQRPASPGHGQTPWDRSG